MQGLVDKIKAEKFQEIYREQKHPYNHQNLTHYHLDTNLFTPMYAPQIHLQNQCFSIVADCTKSASINVTNEMIHQRTGNTYCRLINYENGTFALLSVFSNVTSPGAKIITPDGLYHFIIYLRDHLDELGYRQEIELRIDRKPHFYLNKKEQDHVALAGEIKFKKINEHASEILEINEHSGCFQTQTHGSSELFLAKMESIRKAIIAVGLPMNKFKYYIAERHRPRPLRVHSVHEIDVTKIKRVPHK